MRFLIEKRLLEVDRVPSYKIGPGMLPSAEQIEKYNNLKTDKDKKAFIEKFLKSHRNARNLTPDLAGHIDGIFKSGWNSAYTKFILTRLGEPIHSDVSKIIRDLSLNGKLNPMSFAMTDQSLFEGDPEDIVFKIKMIALVTDPAIRNKYKDLPNFNIDALKDKSGNFLSAEDMRAQLNKWSEEPIDREKFTGYDFIKSQLGKEPTEEQSKDFIKRYLPNREDIRNKVDSKEYSKQLDKILKSSLNSPIGRSREEVFKSLINNAYIVGKDSWKTPEALHAIDSIQALGLEKSTATSVVKAVIDQDGDLDEKELLRRALQSLEKPNGTDNRE